MRIATINYREREADMNNQELTDRIAEIKCKVYTAAQTLYGISCIAEFTSRGDTSDETKAFEAINNIADDLYTALYAAADELGTVEYEIGHDTGTQE